MARIFITGSSDGLGLMAARLLLEQGHFVVAHARDAQRAEHTRRELPGVEAVLTGDFGSLDETKTLAVAANQLGTFDAVIHNAAIGYKERSRKHTVDGLPQVFQTNTLAPYVVTALMHKPKRLVYVSSGSSHPGVACRQRGSCGHGHRGLFLSSSAAKAVRRDARSRAAGQTPGCLRPVLRRDDSGDVDRASEPAAHGWGSRVRRDRSQHAAADDASQLRRSGMLRQRLQKEHHAN